MIDFVTTAWLEEHLNDENIRVIDIRGHVLPASEPLPHYFSHHAEYQESHIPGAVFVDWTSDITDPDSPNGTQIAKPADYAALMSRLGVDENSFVVVYDDACGMFAARLWWTLNYYGHTQVAVLAGHWQAWTAEGRPVTAEIPEITPTAFNPTPDPVIRRTIDQVAENLNNSAIQLVDTRSLAEFNGESSRVERAGRIPGAIHLPRKGLLAEDGTLLPQETLQQMIKDAGLDPDQETVVYCNSGVSASYTMLALHTMGFKNLAVYDGSWKEWGRDLDRPIA